MEKEEQVHLLANVSMAHAQILVFYLFIFKSYFKCCESVLKKK